MTIFLIILGIILYIFIASLYVYILNYVTNEDAWVVATCWIWPVFIPIILCFILGIFFYYLFEKYFKLE